MRRRIEGAEAIASALDRGRALALVLRRDGRIARTGEALVARLEQLGIPVRVESEREMLRMSGGAVAADLLALEGRPPPTDIGTLLSEEGLVVLLVGVRYPGNAGFVVRLAEVAGAAGVILDPHPDGGARRDEILRYAMRADRFLPVLDASWPEAIEAARHAGRRIVAVETSGDRAPWEADLTGPLVAVLGSEAEGLPSELLASADTVVRIPMRGFIPSYNVQAAAGIFVGEWLRRGDASPEWGAGARSLSGERESDP